MTIYALRVAVLATSLIGQMCHSQYVEKSGSLVHLSAKAFLSQSIQPNSLSETPLPLLITGFLASDTFAMVNSNTLFELPKSVCSGFSSTVCYQLAGFYKPTTTQLIATGIWRVSNNTLAHLGVNTGFQSPKLKVSPAFYLGVTQRFFLDDKQLSQLSFEATGWVGSKVQHKPCVDSYNREYFCGDLTAWSDYKYDSRPKSYTLNIRYMMRF